MEDRLGVLEEELGRRKKVEDEQGAKMAELGARLVKMEKAKEQESSGGQEEKEREIERELKSLRAAVGETGGEIGEAWRVRNSMEEVLGNMRKEGEKMARESERMAKEKGEEVGRMEERLGGEVEVLRKSVERWTREEVDGRGVVTVAKGVAESGPAEPDAGGKVAPGGKVRWVVLTDSNGRRIKPDNIKAHIPRHQRDRFDIRVEVIYTLMEAYDKLGRGGLKVEGEAVLLDVSTNDVRGTARVPRTRPDEVAARFERVARLLLEKGAVGVCVCEVKPMNFMDVTPYSNAIHSACLRMRAQGHQVQGMETQIGVSNLMKDGFHIMPSFAGVLDKTYACAVVGVPVSCPTPSWDRYRDPSLKDRWPTPREAQGQGNSHGRG